MALQLMASSAVVVAEHFNPSVTGQYWLVKNKIVSPEELRWGQCSPTCNIQVPTRDFHLLVTPDNCQFGFPTPVTDEMLEKQQALLEKKHWEHWFRFFRTPPI